MLNYPKKLTCDKVFISISKCLEVLGFINLGSESVHAQLYVSVQYMIKVEDGLNGYVWV